MKLPHNYIFLTPRLHTYTSQIHTCSICTVCLYLSLSLSLFLSLSLSLSLFLSVCVSLVLSFSLLSHLLHHAYFTSFCRHDLVHVCLTLHDPLPSNDFFFGPPLAMLGSCSLLFEFQEKQVEDDRSKYPEISRSFGGVCSIADPKLTSLWSNPSAMRSMRYAVLRSTRWHLGVLHPEQLGKTSISITGSCEICILQAAQVYRLLNRGRVVLGHPHIATGAMKRLAENRKSFPPVSCETSFNEHDHTGVLWN
jgi:hypothetical protein